MGSGNRKQVWHQLAVMYQGLLFLGGHVVDHDLAAGGDCVQRSRAAADQAAARAHAPALLRRDAWRRDADTALPKLRPEA